MSTEALDAGSRGAATAPHGMGSPERRFERFAAALLAYLLLVILFGAWVRVTGSGAGCGEHWPTCHGELLPRTPSQATLIEFGHRLSSGLLGLLCVALPVWAFRRFPRGHAARRASLATLAFVAVEAAIGARLVLHGLVASDASLARAVAVALHLVNTLLLTASAALTVAAARSSSWDRPAREQRELALAKAEGTRLAPFGLWMTFLLCLVLVSATGTITALGDTLFPVASLEHPPPPDHFLVQLRIVHPVLASAVVLFGFEVARRFSELARTRLWARAVGALCALQLGIGLMNIALAAPGWLQLVHLLCAQLLWISAVMLGYRTLRAPPLLVQRRAAPRYAARRGAG